MKFTIEQVDDALRKVINRDPHFVYTEKTATACYYHQGPFHDPERCDGCVFGQALQLLGVSKDDLADIDTSIASIRQVEFDFLPPKVTRPDYWCHMQAQQDGGAAWGDLLEYLPKP